MHRSGSSGRSTRPDAFRCRPTISCASPTEPTTSLLGRPWTEFARALDLDAADRIARAIANRETFSGITVAWPINGRQERAPVALSGMPMYDGARNFAGYRGFGIYRQATLPAAADHPSPGSVPAVADRVEHPKPNLSHDSISDTAAVILAAPDIPSLAETETVEPPKNVVPFPLTNDTRTPSLSAVENHAFDEIARRLTQTIDSKDGQSQADRMTGSTRRINRTRPNMSARQTRNSRPGLRPRLRRPAATAPETGCCSTSCRRAS